MNLYKPRAYKQQFTHTVFRIPHCFKLTAIFLRFALQPFTISWGKLPLFQTVFCFPSGVEIVGFNCSLLSFYPSPPRAIIIAKRKHCKTHPFYGMLHWAILGATCLWHRLPEKLPHVTDMLSQLNHWVYILF